MINVAEKFKANFVLLSPSSILTLQCLYLQACSDFITTYVNLYDIFVLINIHFMDGF